MRPSITDGVGVRFPVVLAFSRIDAEKHGDRTRHGIKEDKKHSAQRQDSSRDTRGTCAVFQGKDGGARADLTSADFRALT